MKKLIAVLVLFVFAVACAPPPSDDTSLVNITEIEMLQQNDVEQSIADDLNYENITLLTADDGKIFISDGYKVRRVIEDGIMYLREVPFPGGNAGAVPCSQSTYDNAKGEELILQKSFDVISYYKLGTNGEIYHKDVFYKPVNNTDVGKAIAAL